MTQSTNTAGSASGPTRAWWYYALSGYVALGVALASYHRPSRFCDPKDADVWRSHLRLPEIWEILLAVGVFCSVFLALALFLVRLRGSSARSRAIVVFLCSIVPSLVLWYCQHDAYTPLFASGVATIACIAVYLHAPKPDLAFLRNDAIAFEARKAKLDHMISNCKAVRTVVAGIAPAVFLLASVQTSISFHQMIESPKTVIEQVVRRDVILVLYLFAGLYGGVVPMLGNRLKMLIDGFDALPEPKRSGQPAAPADRGQPGAPHPSTPSGRSCPFV